MLERTLITSIALVLVLTIAMFLASFVHADLGALALFVGMPLVLLVSIGSWIWRRERQSA